MNLGPLKNKKNQDKLFTLAILFFILGTSILYLYGPENTIKIVGIANSYIIAFFMGAFGGSFVLTAGVYYFSIFTIAQHGLNPLLLGLIGGTGLTLGDSLFYYMGFRGKEVKMGWIQEKVRRFGEWLKDKPKIFVLLVVFIYIAFIPLPNDLLLVSVGLAGYSFKLAMIAVLIGNIVFITILGLISQGLFA